jgi:hypothetical protein
MRATLALLLTIVAGNAMAYDRQPPVANLGMGTAPVLGREDGTGAGGLTPTQIQIILQQVREGKIDISELRELLGEPATRASISPEFRADLHETMLPNGKYPEVTTYRRPPLPPVVIPPPEQRHPLKRNPWDY